QPRRDSSDQDVSTATLNWRTQISEARMAFQKERRELQANLVVPFVFGNRIMKSEQPLDLPD
ncbi:MAG TPA: hypothetical protein VGO68_00415, partial [Pyrinomonadaceae bacterium]|nr:hypothetical protein [Pyrinomonadaceae bacterium]